MIRSALRASLVLLTLGALAPVALAQDGDLPGEIEDRDPQPRRAGERPVSPDADREARRLFQRGQLQFERGEHRDAIVSFEAAYALSHRPLLLYNTSLAYEELGERDRAAEYLARYLEEDHEMPRSERRRHEAHLRELREAPSNAVLWLGAHLHPQLWLSVLDDVMLHISAEARYRLTERIELAGHLGYATIGKSGMSGGSSGFTIGLGATYGLPIIANAWKVLFRGVVVFEDYFADNGGASRQYYALRPGVGIAFRVHPRVSLELTAEAAGGLTQFTGGGASDETQSDFALLAGARFAVLVGLF